MGTHLGQAGVEGDGRALERLQRQRERDDRGVEQTTGVADGECAGGGHQVGAVDQGQALLGGQDDGMQTGAVERRRPLHALAAQRGLTFADEHERDMGQRREVARGPHRALGRDNRDHVALEHRQQQLDDLRAHSGVPPAQRCDQQREHSAHDLSRQRGAGADGMRAHEVELQSRGVVGADAHAGQVADAGGDAVDRASGSQRAVDHRTRAGDPCAVLSGQRRGRGAPRHALELLQGRHREPRYRPRRARSEPGALSFAR
jgi:hypothetical protein